MNTPIVSALVVLIPEAETLVEDFRKRYDPSAASGVPAHVTILFPFKTPDEVTADVIAALRKLFSEQAGFTARFSELRQFPDAIYLAPVPAEPFRRLIKLVAGRFPETPPYGGVFAEIVPHLTVAQVGDPRRIEDIAADFREAARDRLPITASVHAVSLMDNAGGPWQVRAHFPLGPDRPARQRRLPRPPKDGSQIKRNSG